MNKVFSVHLLHQLTEVGMRRDPKARKGQTMWNTAVRLWPKQVEPLRDRDRDPYYDDQKCGAFVAALQEADWT